MTPAKPSATAKRARPARRIGPIGLDLALQGGGSLGAFTWGVLDTLLQVERIRIDGICGTSAGALNAAVLATGYAQSGADGARRALAAFWADVGASGGLFGSSIAASAGSFNLDTHPWYAWVGAWSRLLSPYQTNPLGLDPLRDLLRRHVDEAALRRGPIRVFVAATAVTTGQPRIFSGDSLSLDALLASACLPQVFRAVHIDGVPYWDGGYSGNPALWPLIYDTPAVDLLLVRINPLARKGLPETAEEIQNRVNELTFNAGLVGEMRAIAFVHRLLQDKRLDAGRYKNLRLHMIGDDAALAEFNASSHMNTDPRFLKLLFERGSATAARWLATHGQDLGRRATVDIEATFLKPRDVGF